MDEAQAVNKIEANLPREKQTLSMTPRQRKQITGKGPHQEVKTKIKKAVNRSGAFKGSFGS